MAGELKQIEVITHIEPDNETRKKSKEMEISFIYVQLIAQLDAEVMRCKSLITLQENSRVVEALVLSSVPRSLTPSSNDTSKRPPTLPHD